VPNPPCLSWVSIPNFWYFSFSFSGTLRDHLGSCTVPFVLAGIPPIVGAVALFAVRCVNTPTDVESPPIRSGELTDKDPLRAECVPVTQRVSNGTTIPTRMVSATGERATLLICLPYGLRWEKDCTNDSLVRVWTYPRKARYSAVWFQLDLSLSCFSVSGLITRTASKTSTRRRNVTFPQTILPQSCLQITSLTYPNIWTYPDLLLTELMLI